MALLRSLVRMENLAIQPLLQGRWMCDLPALKSGWKKLEYKTLQVWDTSELEVLEKQLKKENVRLQEVHRIGREENRRVMWRSAYYDMKAVERVQKLIEHAYEDPHRKW